MHIYMITRGIKHDSDRFINELSTKYLPFDYAGTPSFVQVAVRPIQLWEVVFPQEHYDLMMNTLFCGTKNGLPPELEKFNFLVKILRKKMGIIEAPDYAANPANKMILYDNNVQRTCIGIKKDPYRNMSGAYSDTKENGFFEGL